MPAVGKRSEVKQQAMVRLGAIGSQTFSPTLDAQEDCLVSAIAWYEKLRPLQKIHQSASDGVTKRFVLATLINPGWEAGISEVASVASVTAPDSSDETITDVPVDKWEQSKSASGADVLMLGSPVPTGSTLRIAYSASHVVDADDADDTTIPAKDGDALISMTAAYMARWISRKASDSAAASLGADQIDAEPIGERWARRAKELEKMATDRLAPPAPEASIPAGASIDWDTQSSLGRQGRIGH